VKTQSFLSEWNLVHVRRPLAQVFIKKNFFIVLEYFFKHGKICSHDHTFAEVGYYKTNDRYRI
jgi:hypothetical protein